MENGNHNWQDAMDVEMAQIKEYEVFKDCGKAKWEGKTISNAPSGYQNIRVHFLFAVKHCGKLWEDCLLMATSPRNQWNLCTLELFLSEDSDWLCSLLNSTNSCYGEEMLAMLTLRHSPGKTLHHCRPEFGELQGHIFIIYKALYGTKTGGA